MNNGYPLLPERPEMRTSVPEPVKKRLWTTDMSLRFILTATQAAHDRQVRKAAANVAPVGTSTPESTQRLVPSAPISSVARVSQSGSNDVAKAGYPDSGYRYDKPSTASFPIPDHEKQAQGGDSVDAHMIDLQKKARNELEDLYGAA